MADLTCYRLKMAGGAEGSLDTPIDPDNIEDLIMVGPKTIAGARAKLFFAPPKSNPPDWKTMLTSVLGDDADIPNVAGASAVMIVERERAGEFFYLAFTFGGGWRLLRSDAYQRAFGLKACLNIVFEGDTGSGDWDPARLRSVDSKRVGANILRARHQVSGTAALEDLDVNARRDLVNGVTGIPQQRDGWGTRVTGRDALQFSHPSFDDLGPLCDQILDASDGDDYTHRFAFIDDFVGVTDPLTRTRLVEEVVANLQASLTGSLDLAPPELVDWERIGGFQLHTERRGTPLTRNELRLDGYLSSLAEKGKIGDISLDCLRRWSIWAVDGSGSDVTKWSVWSCLFGELALDGETYVLDDGDFYQVSGDYLGALDAEVEAIPECDKDFIAWEMMWHEDDYNKALADSSENLLLLDRKTVRVGSHTNQVEICDVLSVDGYFIHVKKRGDGSASLSHLFNQGFVSADLAIGSHEFRRVALEKIKVQENARATVSGDASYKGKFKPFDEDAAVASQCEVVFAIHPEPGKGGPRCSRSSARSL